MNDHGQQPSRAKNHDQELKAVSDCLVQQALSLGAHDAAVLQPDQVQVEDRLAAMCADLKCEGYGQSMSCPPCVSGPDGIRARLKQARLVLAFSFEVPKTILHSSQRWELFGLLHETAASLERFARDAGFANSFGLAGGSCKTIFCARHYQCRVVFEGGPCRNPDSARPSMSGFGINVSDLCHKLGWPMESSTSDASSSHVPTALLVGMVVVG